MYGSNDYWPGWLRDVRGRFSQWQIISTTNYQSVNVSRRTGFLKEWETNKNDCDSNSCLVRSKIQQHLKYSDQLDKTIKMVGLPVWPPCPIHVTSAAFQRYKDPLKGESGVKTYILPFMSPQCTTQSPPHPAAVFGNKHQWACKYKQLKTASVKMSWNNRRPLQPRV